MANKPPDIDAYGGWIRLAPHWPWQRLCAAYCYDVCWDLLEMQAAEAQPATVMSLVVLPKGLIPTLPKAESRD